MATYPMSEPNYKPILRTEDLTLIAGGRAGMIVEGASYGQNHVWLCRPDGTKLQRMSVATLAEVEARAQALIAKGAL